MPNSRLPIPSSTYLDQWLPPGRAAARIASRAWRDAELEVFQHQLWATVTLTNHQTDTEVAERAAEFALDKEMQFLSYGLHLAGDNRVGHELVARKLNQLVTTDERRFNRDFGR